MELVFAYYANNQCVGTVQNREGEEEEEDDNVGRLTCTDRKTRTEKTVESCRVVSWILKCS